MYIYSKCSNVLNVLECVCVCVWPVIVSIGIHSRILWAIYGWLQSSRPTSSIRTSRSSCKMSNRPRSLLRERSRAGSRTFCCKLYRLMIPLLKYVPAAGDCNVSTNYKSINMHSETDSPNSGLLVEVWTKGMIWDRALGYQLIALDTIPYSGDDSPGLWYELDTELVVMNGEVAGTRTPTGHMLLLDCRFEMPFGRYINIKPTKYPSFMCEAILCSRICFLVSPPFVGVC